VYQIKQSDPHTILVSPSTINANFNYSFSLGFLQNRMCLKYILGFLQLSSNDLFLGRSLFLRD